MLQVCVKLFPLLLYLYSITFHHANVIGVASVVVLLFGMLIYFWVFLLCEPFSCLFLCWMFFFLDVPCYLFQVLQIYIEYWYTAICYYFQKQILLIFGKYVVIIVYHVYFFWPPRPCPRMQDPR